MKLQYGMVEYNLKKLYEKSKLYDEACNRNDMERAAEIMDDITKTLVALRGSIKNGSWYSQELQILNGRPYPEPDSFYIFLNKTY